MLQRKTDDVIEPGIKHFLRLFEERKDEEDWAEGKKNRNEDLRGEIDQDGIGNCINIKQEAHIDDDQIGPTKNAGKE